MKRKFLATTTANRYTEPDCQWVNIDDKGWVNGETPVEDFGMFFLSNIECAPSEAMEVFLALMLESEGDLDYRGEPITDKPEDYLTSDSSRAIYATLQA